MHGTQFSLGLLEELLLDLSPNITLVVRLFEKLLSKVKQALLL